VIPQSRDRWLCNSQTTSMTVNMTVEI
jgi:hypothetical protein